MKYINEYIKNKIKHLNQTFNNEITKLAIYIKHLNQTFKLQFIIMRFTNLKSMGSEFNKKATPQP